MTFRVRLSGDLTDEGRRASASLQAILDDLPTVNARTPADALALASIAGDMLGVLAANAEGGPLAQAAVFSLAKALAGLKTCLSELSGRRVDEFAVALPVRPTPAH